MVRLICCLTGGGWGSGGRGLFFMLSCSSGVGGRGRSARGREMGRGREGASNLTSAKVTSCHRFTCHYLRLATGTASIASFLTSTWNMLQLLV